MQDCLNSLFAQIKPRRVLETGTHHGLGTMSLVQAAKINGLSTKVATLECNLDTFKFAKNYTIKDHPLVQQRLGLSIPRYMLPSVADVQREFVDHAEDHNGAIYYDHKPNDRAAAYVYETRFTDVEDDAVVKILHEEEEPVSLLFLDTAGHLGRIEFHYILGILLREPHLVTQPFYVMLCATRHCKHFKSLAFVRQNPAWQVVQENTHGFGWALVKLSTV